MWNFRLVLFIQNKKQGGRSPGAENRPRRSWESTCLHDRWQMTRSVDIVGGERHRYDTKVGSIRPRHRGKDA